MCTHGMRSRGTCVRMNTNATRGFGLSMGICSTPSGLGGFNFNIIIGLTSPDFIQQRYLGPQVAEETKKATIDK